MAEAEERYRKIGAEPRRTRRAPAKRVETRELAK
jgi:hypothetical protein